MNWTSKIVLCILLTTRLYTYGQDKASEYRAIQQIEADGFKLKTAECGLKGVQRRNQITRRSLKFREAVVALNSWISKYFPDGKNNITTGYVQSNFVLAWYIENSNDYKTALQYYRWVSLMQRHLYDNGLPLAKYNGVDVLTIIEDKIPGIVAINKYLAVRYQYTFDILKSTDSEIAQLIAAMSNASENDGFRDAVSDTDDQSFIIQTLAKSIADSIAGEDISRWATIYSREIAERLNLPYHETKSIHYVLCSIGDNIKARDQLGKELTRMEMQFQKTCVGDDTAKTVTTLLVNVTDRQLMTRDEFERVFDFNYKKPVPTIVNPNDSAAVMLHEMLEKNRADLEATEMYQRTVEAMESQGRILIEKHPIKVDSDSLGLMLEIMVQTAGQWIVTDFDTISPPDWLIGLPLMFYWGNNDRIVDTPHLYALQTALETNKFPDIEYFIKNFKQFDGYDRFAFADSYSAYFCLFLISNGLFPDLYQTLKTDPSLKDPAVLVAWINKKIKHRGNISLTEVFKRFVQKRDTKNIADADKGLRKRIIDETTALLNK